MIEKKEPTVKEIIIKAIGEEIGHINGVLLIVFVVLKLTNLIDWSWWWVAAPFWVPCCIAVSVLVIWFAVVFIKLRLKRRKNERDGE